MDEQRIDELIALTALGEITPAEEAELDAAIAADASVADELAADLAVAARLQAAHREPPPATLKQNVMEAIDAIGAPATTDAKAARHLAADAPLEADDTEVRSLDAQRTARRRRRRWQPLAAAAAAVLLIAGGLFVTNRGGDGEPTFAAIVEASDIQARVLAGELPGSLEVVYSPSQGAFVLSGTAPVLTAAETYQVWFVDGTNVTSVGLFTPDDTGRVAQVFDGSDPSDVVVGITIEPAGGSSAPTLPIVASATASPPGVARLRASGRGDGFDYFLDFNSAAQQLALDDSTFPVAPDYPTTTALEIKSAVEAAPGAWPNVLNERGEALKQLTENRSGGDRPNFDEAWSSGTPSRNSARESPATSCSISAPVTARIPASRSRCSTTPTSSMTPTSLRGRAIRWRRSSTIRSSASSGIRMRDAARRARPELDGKVKVPVLTMHNLGDLFVPFHMETEYRATVEAAGNGDLLVQRAIRGVGHCGFHSGRVRDGVRRPCRLGRGRREAAGDDVGDPAAVAAPTRSRRESWRCCSRCSAR